MSHHYSGPQLGFPCGDPRLDFCDLYAFPKSDDASKSILVMNVHPSSSVSVDRSPDAAPTELTTSVPFASDAIYELKIDTNGDNVADVTYRVVFSPFTSEGQTATLRLIKEPLTKIADGDGEVVIERAVVSLDAEPSVAEGAGHRLFLGWRSDPFFFDPPAPSTGSTSALARMSSLTRTCAASFWRFQILFLALAGLLFGPGRYPTRAAAGSRRIEAP